MTQFLRLWWVWLALCAALGVLFFFIPSTEPAPEFIPPATEVVDETEKTPVYPIHQIIGESVEGRSIDAYTYGSGENHLLFVGGVHGGYEWNSVLLAYEFMDYFASRTHELPDSLRITIVPSLNPDGVYRALQKEGRFVRADVPPGAGEGGVGRMNARNVDLNRNFDCKWSPTSMWRSQTVSAGAEPFSEPEARALRDFVAEIKPHGVVFWHSKAKAVYASECTEGILPQTLSMMNVYARASGYAAVPTFDAYAITGDAEGWLASIGIPAVTVELATHTELDWEQNLKGVQALFELFSAGE